MPSVDSETGGAVPFPGAWAAVGPGTHIGGQAPALMTVSSVVNLPPTRKMAVYGLATIQHPFSAFDENHTQAVVLAVAEHGSRERF